MSVVLKADKRKLKEKKKHCAKEDMTLKKGFTVYYVKLVQIN